MITAAYWGAVVDSIFYKIISCLFMAWFIRSPLFHHCLEIFGD